MSPRYTVGQHLLEHLLDALGEPMPYSQRRFCERDSDTGDVLFSVDSATNISPSRQPQPLRDAFIGTSGQAPLTTLVAELSKDGRLRFGEDVEFDPSSGHWVLGRFGAARFLGLSEKQIQRTLEQEDEWAPRIGRLRAYHVDSLHHWGNVLHAPGVAAAHQAAASLPRGAAAAIRRCEKRWGIIGESRGTTGNSG